MAKIHKVITELSECPCCGGSEWYRKERYTGTCKIGFGFDGKDSEIYHCGADIYNNAFHVITSKFAYCSDCHKPIALLG